MLGRSSWQQKVGRTMLNPDFKDILSTLCAHKVEFLLVGAYAMAAHGLPRATGDIDIWVRPDVANAALVLKALKDFGAPVGSLTIADLTTPGIVFQMGLPPRRIDILTQISGVDFETTYTNRFEIELEGLVISVLRRVELLINKRASGRPKDLADLAWLEAH
jgi:hypothetical protein